MRDIKFRAWDKEERSMVTLPDVNLVIEETGEFRLEDSPNYLWMQYTGLKDRNGVEIYEGDVLAFRAWKNKHRGVVQWDAGLASYQLKMNRTSRTGLFRDPMRSYEVIGNIYEHPDLFEAVTPGEQD